MKKYIRISLILLALVVVVIISFPQAYLCAFYTKRTSSYISELTLNGQGIYFGAGHCLYSLDTRDHALHELQCEKGSTFGQPAVGEGRAYAQVGQFLVAVDLSNHEIVWRVDQSGEPGYEYDSEQLHHPGATLLAEDIVITRRRWGLQFYNAQTGNLLWRTEPNRMQDYTYVLDDKTVWYIVNSTIDELDSGSLKGLAIDTGALNSILDLRPAVRFDELLAINDQWIWGAMDKGENPRYIFAINRQQIDQVQWFSETHFQWTSHPVIYNNLFIIRVDDSMVYALDVNTGQVVWLFVSGANHTTLRDVTQIVPFRLCERHDRIHNCRLYALDAATGSAAWEYYLNAEVYGLTEPVVSGTTVYIGNRDSIDVIDLETGGLLQKIKVNSVYEFYISKSGLYD